MPKLPKIAKNSQKKRKENCQKEKRFFSAAFFT
jgi:hypothetical protein